MVSTSLLHFFQGRSHRLADTRAALAGLQVGPCVTRFKRGRLNTSQYDFIILMQYVFPVSISLSLFHFEDVRQMEMFLKKWLEHPMVLPPSAMTLEVLGANLAFGLAPCTLSEILTTHKKAEYSGPSLNATSVWQNLRRHNIWADRALFLRLALAYCQKQRFRKKHVTHLCVASSSRELLKCLTIQLYSAVWAVSDLQFAMSVSRSGHVRPKPLDKTFRLGLSMAVPPDNSNRKHSEFFHV